MIIFVTKRRGYFILLFYTDRQWIYLCASLYIFVATDIVLLSLSKLL